MKRTTYIMLGAFIAGFILIGAVCLFFISHQVPEAEYDRSSIISEETNISTVEEPIADQFSHIVYQNVTEGRRIITFKGLTVQMSDTVDAPVLHTVSSSEKIIDMTVRNDTLFLTADLSSLNDSLMKVPKLKRLINNMGLTTLPLSVILPQGMKLGSVTNRSNSVWLNDIRASRLNIRTGSDLTLDGCDIDTLRYYGRNLRDLKLSKSVIGLFTMSMPSHEVNVDCCDDSGFIKVMEVRGGKPANSYAELYMTKANVGSLKWLPENDKATLNVIVNKPTELTQINTPDQGNYMQSYIK